MLVRVWPGLDFWYYLAIISSPSWVSSFLAMDFIKKTSDLVFIFLISTLALSWSASNLLLSMFYFSLRRNPETNRFFRGHECAGKTIGFVLGVLGNVGLYYFSEKSVACILTFLFLAFYCLCALFCIQPYMGFGALEFLLTASLNPTLCRFGLRSPYSWLVIIACIVIEGIRYSLQPQHRPEQATRDEVELVELEAGELPPITYNEDSPHLGSPLDNNHSPSDILFEPAPAGEPTTPLLVPIGSTAERFHALLLKDSGVLYEDPCIQIGVKAKWRAHQGQLVLSLENKNTAPLVSVQALILPPSHLNIELSVVPETIPPRAQMQCPLEVINLHPSRDVAFLDFSYKFGTQEVNVKLRLPALLNKFLQPIPVSAEEFFPQWRSLSGPPLKLQEVVKGVRPMSIPEMENLFNNLRLLVCPGLDPNPNNLVASTTFYSKSTRAMLCLIRIETDPADRTQLRMTVASGDPALTYELKEFVKEQLVYVPTSSGGPAAPLPQAQPSSPPTAVSDHAGLLH